MGLFRQEALDASRHRLQGQVVLLPQWPHALLCALLLAWVALAAVYLTQASYSRKETVRGWLEPAGGVVRIFPQSSGRVAQLLVEQDDVVYPGQPLVIINGDRVMADGEHLEAVLLREYRTQKTALERQLAGARALADLRVAELDSRIERAGMTLESLAEAATTIQERLRLSRQRITRYRALAASGHLNAAELELLEEQRLVLAGEQQQQRIQRLRQEALLAQLTSERRRLPQDTRNTSERLRVALSELSADIARLRGNRAHVLTAPVAGKVSNIGLQAGQRAHFDRALITLLPEDSALQATLLVPVHAAGFLAEGQPLLIRYDAFPYQKFGQQQGEVRKITASAILPVDHANLPLRVTEPVFRVTALPASQTVDAYGRGIALKAGMTLSADIVLEHRSLLQWLLEPLQSLRGRLT